MCNAGLADPLSDKVSSEAGSSATMPDTMASAVPRRILPVIVLSQFAGTSLWFAVNAVLPDLQRGWALPPAALATVTTAVQLGFVAGTLVFALLTLSDRFAPTRVFLACALGGAACNAAIALLEGQYALLVALRFAVGFLLGGSVGLGTVVYALAIGPVVQALLPLLVVPLDGPKRRLERRQHAVAGVEAA